MDKILVETQQDREYRFVRKIWSDVTPAMTEVKNASIYWMKKVSVDFGISFPETSLKFFVGQLEGHNVHATCRIVYMTNGNKKFSLNFNMGSIMLELPYVIRQIVPHEVFHLATEFIYPEKGMAEIAHETEWKELMVFYGLPPDVKAGFPKEVIDRINNMFLENES